MDIENAANTISESDYGAHTLVVNKDLEVLRVLFLLCKKGLREKKKLFN